MVGIKITLGKFVEHNYCEPIGKKVRTLLFASFVVMLSLFLYVRVCVCACV